MQPFKKACKYEHKLSIIIINLKTLAQIYWLIYIYIYSQEKQLFVLMVGLFFRVFSFE